MPTHRRRIGDGEASALANICCVAAEHFKKNAEDVRKSIGAKSPSEEALYLSEEVAQWLADQFDHQAQEARNFASIFDAAGEFHIPVEDATNG